ncbi:MAG: hypothetical protein ABFR33_03170 [Verrucomicrobiota bacterium]
MMEFWEALWKTVFVCGLASFALLAVWVSIGGARDIKKMLRNLNQEHETGADEPAQDERE